MFTVIETPTFSRLCLDYWTEDERGAFAAWIAANPESSVVIKGSGGCRKVRWSRPVIGKRGGVRVIYFTQLGVGEIWMLLVYTKSMKDNIPGHLFKAIREEIENG